MPTPTPLWAIEQLQPEHLGGGLRGLERETLRVGTDGRLSSQAHPISIGSALTHPRITTDYSEALLEFVTPPVRRNTTALADLTEVHAFVQQRLDDELLWPASMPCIGAADDDVPIADYGSSNGGLFRTVYRRGLGHRYGRAMQAIAGVHFNYSPPAELWQHLRELRGSALTDTQFRSDCLMGLVRNYRRLAWVIAYLFGASPVVAKSFRPDGHARLESLNGSDWYAPHATSLRMSDLGYRNKTQARLAISANSLAEYAAQLRRAVSTHEPAYAQIGVEVDGAYRQLNSNALQIENEYYSSIRPKPGNRDLRPVAALERFGVEYVELRNLDSDPLSPVGIGPVQMACAELLLLVCLVQDSPPISASEQVEIDQRELTVAWEGRRPGLMVTRAGSAVKLADWGAELADQVASVSARIGSDYYQAAAEHYRSAFADPGITPSARMLRSLGTPGGADNSLEFGLELAEAHRAALTDFTYSPGREAELTAMAEASIAEARALEASPQPPFAEYLAEYFDQ